MKIENKSRKSIKRIFPLPFYVYLSYLVICTLLLTGVSFSSYISGADASDSARVAAGLVTVSYNENTTTVEMERPADPDNQMETKGFSFNVSNCESEVAIRYDVIVTLEKTLPNGVTMTLDGEECFGNADNTYTFSNMGTFEAGVQNTRTHTLSFTGDFTTYDTDGTYEYPVTISVRSEQID